MKTIRTLVINPNAPDTNSVWLYKGTMKYFNNGEWETVDGGATSIDWDNITNKPDFAKVAISGDYLDLSNTPTIPDFATVATSGSYNDLLNKPTIPPAYTLPLSASTIRGGIKIGFAQANKKYPVQLQNEQAFVEVPWTDTKYTLPAATKTTLGGIKAGTDIAALAEDAELTTVIETVNSILTQLKTAGVLI